MQLTDGSLFFLSLYIDLSIIYLSFIEKEYWHLVGRFGIFGKNFGRDMVNRKLRTLRNAFWIWFFLLLMGFEEEGGGGGYCFFSYSVGSEIDI